MGVVYKAHHKKLGRLAALKFLPPYLSTDPEANERFMREAKAASRLNHANICTIYDIGETEEAQVFLAMEYIAGETLREKIKQGPLPVEEVLDYAVQVATGLSAAHAAGIVHRDVKPANVMVADSGVVKVVDFGLAKAAEQVQLTKTGSTMGTAAYMSPEQARGTTVDARTDVWALGVVLYEMLTGERPFKGNYDQALIYALLNEEIEPVSALRPDVPKALARAVEGALKKDPASRTASMTEFLGALKAAEASLLPSAAPPPFDIKALLRQPRFIAAAVTLLLGTAALMAWRLDHNAKVRWGTRRSLA